MSDELNRSIHDNFVYSFIIACEERLIVLHTEFRDSGAGEFTDVVFSGVVAHQFQDVLASNILFGIEAVEVDQVVRSWADLFADRKRYAWPNQIKYRDPEHLVSLLHERGLKAFEISSSFGLSGFVFATAMELRRREAKAVLA